MRIKLESDVRKNRSIKPKIRWKAKKSPGVWQDQHQTLEVQQALISLTPEIVFSPLSISTGELPVLIFLRPFGRVYMNKYSILMNGKMGGRNLKNKMYYKYENILLG